MKASKLFQKVRGALRDIPRAHMHKYGHRKQIKNGQSGLKDFLQYATIMKNMPFMLGSGSKTERQWLRDLVDFS
ncbi:hypothetical protein PAAG_01745 [Paracoccidioides lutzii Pb01]|uniref:Uncharacterized protein n=1 Tax=Paracoccidioides lutzii (strain ATCC MYA-826 / Pb01) TaxID=502779 RepID=C1GTA0_PARBA|nr:hypothetical protein PAAG_01745 [Paracoccidioides lutzii Pb01]EEH39283.2 hypothetical protein PAAG_01745 [Paracoccidioides lutzii Pb01]